MSARISEHLTAAAFAAAASLSLPAIAAPTITFTTLPTYGNPVSVQLRDSDHPTYLPATRYKVDGSTIVIEYEYLNDGFGPFSPDFGNPPLSLGELAPGNYTVQARLYDIDQPKASPQILDNNIPVIPPDAYGLYMVPMEPQAWSPTQVLVKSAAYFDPASMRASMSGNVIRVDFDYYGSAPVGGSMPAGTTSFSSVVLPSLQPGAYKVEGWGRDKAGGNPVRYFTTDFTVAPSAPVIEYYNASLDHYFITAGPDEIAMLDRGVQGDWKRTGQRFKAWLRASDAPPSAKTVCRFYAQGPNSHFYTGDDGECRYLRALEQQQRADATAQGKPFLGWQYEGIAFYAVMPDGGACPGGMTTVYRSYNKRFAENDSNHRFTADPLMRVAMNVGWADEGAAFCAPS
jgi:hypothetical protein